MNPETTANPVVQAARRGTPWFMLATVGLLIAKFAFGVKIALLWCFAPLWAPTLICLVLILTPIIIGAILIGLVLAGAWCVDEWNRRKWRRRNKAARTGPSGSQPTRPVQSV